MRHNLANIRSENIRCQKAGLSALKKNADIPWVVFSIPQQGVILKKRFRSMASSDTFPEVMFVAINHMKGILSCSNWPQSNTIDKQMNELPLIGIKTAV